MYSENADLLLVALRGGGRETGFSWDSKTSLKPRATGGTSAPGGGIVFEPYAVLERAPTAGSALDGRRDAARLGVAGMSEVEIAGEAPRLLACLLAPRVDLRVDMVGSEYVVGWWGGKM